jgi:hypothetical protein
MAEAGGEAVTTIENLKLISEVREFVFYRADGWYLLAIPRDTVRDNAECNTGTIKVIDTVTGEQVWP